MKYTGRQKANNLKQLIISNLSSLGIGFRSFRNANLTKCLNDE